MMVTLVKLTESDKRLIVVLLLVFILVFVIAGYIGVAISKVMHHQGKKMDDLVHDVVVTGVITEEKKLVKFGIKKNHQYFLKKAWIPAVIMAVSGLILLIYFIIHGFDVDIKDYHETGFGTLLWIFDWDNAPRSVFFGKEIISEWPAVISTPHWSWKAWGSYLFIPGIITGGVWFLLCVQAYIARIYRLLRLSKSVFNKSLENFNPDEAPRSPINPE